MINSFVTINKMFVLSLFDWEGILSLHLQFDNIHGESAGGSKGPSTSTPNKMSSCVIFNIQLERRVRTKK